MERGRSETIYLGDHRAVTRTKYGTKLFFDTRDLDVGLRIALDGDWEPWLSPFLMRLVRQGDAVVDVGSNIGFYTTLFAGLVGPQGRVYSFECNPQLFAMLRDSIEINDLQQRCTLFDCALADKVGQATFYQPNRHLGSGNLRGGGLDNETYAEITVPTRTLDTIFTGQEPPIRLLHMDVESAEPLVIAGGHGFLDRHRDMIVMMEVTAGWARQRGDLAPLRASLEYLESTGRILSLAQDNQAAQASIDHILSHDIHNAVAVPRHLAAAGRI